MHADEAASRGLGPLAKVIGTLFIPDRGVIFTHYQSMTTTDRELAVAIASFAHHRLCRCRN